MELFLEITDGSLKGDRIPLRDGLVIGRKDADLSLQDPKVSLKHARVENRLDGNFWLVDLGSSNAIKSDQGKVRELALLPGQAFILGRTRLLVVSVDPFRESTTPEIVVEEQPQEAPTLNPEAPVIVEPPVRPSRGWWDRIQDLVERGVTEGEDGKRDIAPFRPLLRLRFARGQQTGTEWTLGYGPREVGPSSLDLVLDEPGLSGLCFRLIPLHEGPVLKVEEGGQGIVKLNGRAVDSEFLNDGDVIELKNTKIEIIFDRGGANAG